MRLAVLYPGLASRSCADCRKYVYARAEDAEPLRRPARVGLPVLRPAGTSPPCHSCPKIPEGVEPKPENARELSPRHWETWFHYRRCKSVGWNVPDKADWIVLRNADVIRSVEEQCERVIADRRHLQLLAALSRRP